MVMEPLTLSRILDGMLSEPNTFPWTSELNNKIGSDSILNLMQEVANSHRDQQLEADFEDAKRQYDEEKDLPPEKVPPLSRKDLIQLLSESRANNFELNISFSVRNTYIGMPQGSSHKPLCQLRKVSISEMYIRKTHKGRFLLCRVITAPAYLDSILIGVEDPNGFVAQLALYNYPGMTNITHDNLDKFLPTGTPLAIREPTYKLSGSVKGNVPVIRVDSPSDVVFLPNDSSYLQNVSWSSDLKIPSEQIETSSIEDWLTRGRDEFKSQRWLMAAVFFSEGLKFDSTHPTLRLNRALCYLNLGWYNAALADAEEVRTFDGDESSPLRLRASYRSAKAQYMLGNYTQAINYIKTNANNEECRSLIRKAKQRLTEQSTGRYDWVLLFKESQSNTARLDTANYTGPIEVTANVNIGGGRGVSVTRDVKIGELLLVEKPFASCYDSDFHDDILFNAYDFLTNTRMKRTQISLVHKVVERLWDDTKLDQTLKSLYAGPSHSRPHAWKTSRSSPQSRTLKHPLEPVVDIDISRIEAVCTYNHFSTAQVTALCSSRAIESHGHLIYEFASLFNHACQSNAHWYTLGDVIIIRATRHMKKGEEVTIPYMDPKIPFARRSEILSKWGFGCHCLICTADRVDGDAACAERAQALDELEDMSKAADMNVDQSIQRMKSKIKDLENSYSKSSSSLSAPFVSKPSLLSAHSLLSLLYLEKAMLGRYQSHYISLCIEEKIKVMEIGGLVILDKSISGPTKRLSTLQQNHMPIDIRNSQCDEPVKLVVNAIHIAAVFALQMGDLVRGKGWLSVALWIHRIHVGGNKDLFKIVFEKDIQQLRLTDII